MKYKVMQENDSHFVVHDGKDHFKVAKKGLSKDLISKIQAYPKHYDEGGEVTNQPDGMSLDMGMGDRMPASDSRVSYMDALKQLGGDVAYGAGKIAEPLVGPMTTGAGADGQSKYDAGLRNLTGHGVSVASVPSTPPSPASVERPFVNENMVGAPVQSAPSQPMPMSKDPITGAIGGYKAALNNVAKQQGALADKQAEIQQQYIDDMKAKEEAYQEHVGRITAENDQLFKSIQDEKIDPKRIWNNASTGNKISASIGLILGGMGAGLTHGPNQALQVMQNAIDRDVDAQKTELGKKQNLLSHNMQIYRDVNAAENATRLQLATTANALMQKSALESGNPMAQAQAQLAGQQIQLQYAPQMQELALRRMSLQNASPEGRYIRTMVPEKEQSEVFKQLDTRDKMEKQRETLLSNFDQIEKLNTVGNRALHFGFEPAKVTALRDPGLAQLVKDSEGRITPQDTEMIKALFPSPGDTSSTITTKRHQLEKFVGEKMNFNLLGGYGVPQNPRGSFTQAPGTLPLNKGK